MINGNLFWDNEAKGTTVFDILAPAFLQRLLHQSHYIEAEEELLCEHYEERRGKSSLIKIFTNHPQISIGDAQFDVVAADIIDRMRAGMKKSRLGTKRYPTWRAYTIK